MDKDCDRCGTTRPAEELTLFGWSSHNGKDNWDYAGASALCVICIRIGETGSPLSMEDEDIIFHVTEGQSLSVHELTSRLRSRGFNSTADRLEVDFDLHLSRSAL